jgi:hypothetical protein
MIRQKDGGFRPMSNRGKQLGFELDARYCELANERIRKALAEKAVSE